MILVVSNQVSLRFVLQHPGKTIHMAHTATDALRILRTTNDKVEGIVLDERVTNSRLVAGYVRTHVPNLPTVSFQVALRNSPFSTVPESREAAARLLARARASVAEGANRFIYDPRSSA